MDGLTIGRMVHYVLTGDDAQAINHRRIDGGLIGGLTELGQWPQGAQAHVGNHASIGQHVAATVVAVWPNEFGDEPGANLKCHLDGSDDYWATSRRFDPAGTPGTWHWIEKA